ncbi:DegT/DnrJ/EryC1/StrS aminotransferase family protein (plasmid) [Sinorhizobium meliloti]|uniref:DegT/DnrJ/EryC1/StrS aminotransferase family protein n=1 Tax=Rhizobium meliloti TaxID=382 RepID=UPI000B49E28C|nr:DegT/DnrJ/EryC1/StrS aminotransferase family protein [Sinorhizobium meliloti]ASQ07528.1 DegT/DnrJ/EryC1/StrS aminotransferase family protein [Sinorhizobium meliloti]MDX0005691.1 aminotransferase class V-fold PLP-dependent enzyme [Sinorhizobium meliloti]MDX0223245.1 aminotransferase class V-fold PLP-dependent enzyme [Sinorhizobium meliloti]MQU71286.1 aminotransferase class V-fold PLP-dependent enzyme [Sinorhizobium meliloti]MQV41914.1 aminotransferase class V-fold PLP-dependent enzyme [Sinor
MGRWPVYDEEQIEDVVSVLRSGEVNAWTGPHVRNFEAAYERFLGVKHAVALANGTVALDLALFALGLEPGDEVIVTPRSFIASASTVPMAGGVAVFADVDRDSQNITAETIRAKLTPRTKGVIVVHLAGWPCDMPAIMALAREKGLWVIEDCAQAHGAEIDSRPVGSFGDIAAFSFCQDKIITTGGEGGLVAMNDDELWKKAWSRKDHGKSYDAVYHKEHPPGFRWLHESIGTNWRMMSIQAVMGSRQLQRLTEWRSIRAHNAAIIARAAEEIEALRTPLPPRGIQHAWYRFYTFLRPERLRPDWSRDRIIAEINGAGVACFSGSCSEIYLEKAFTDIGMAPAQPLPDARELGETSLAFLVDPALDTAAMEKAAHVLREVFARASIGRPALDAARR